jgi:hypothetical protein
VLTYQPLHPFVHKGFQPIDDGFYVYPHPL